MRLLPALILALLPAIAAASPWRLDPETRVAVDVSWRGSAVEMRFPDLSGTIDFDEKRPETARARIVVASGSVETGLPPVSAVVKGPDFLGSARWPDVVFELDRLKLTSRSTADVDGRLTLRGVTRPVSLKATVTQYGPAPDDPDRFVAGFDITGSVDRTQFGSTGGLPDVAPEIGLRIHLAMSSE
ncbi:YceI family protein [Amaricoccus sp.]|uniref:YceI family protein n=1 Tax=Amaricoccus sp. TaxID=1872485 RepID=UPI001B654680|nr:YceI family protein [Amaricoccus sp.]MBP7001975.1 YceI family protein [Amaricoccus sp.]